MNSTIKIRINNRQYDLLQTYSLLDNNHVDDEEHNSIYLIGDNEYFRSLLDKLSDVLVQKGLLPEIDEPNTLGSEVEAIIDIVSREVYS